MRLFAAIYPSDAACASLAGAVEGADPGLRWSPPGQWHVTVAFYGEVPEDAVPELSVRLARAASRCAPLRLQVRGFGGFPAAGRARTVYAALDGELVALARLARRCEAAGRRTGVVVPARRFRAHLTVARARREPVDVTARFPPYAGPPWSASALRLVRSRLGSVVVHEPVGEWPLSAHHA